MLGYTKHPKCTLQSILFVQIDNVLHVSTVVIIFVIVNKGKIDILGENVDQYIITLLVNVSVGLNFYIILD